MAKKNKKMDKEELNKVAGGRLIPRQIQELEDKPAVRNLVDPGTEYFERKCGGKSAAVEPTQDKDYLKNFLTLVEKIEQ